MKWKERMDKKKESTDEQKNKLLFFIHFMKHKSKDSTSIKCRQLVQLSLYSAYLYNIFGHLKSLERKVFLR